MDELDAGRLRAVIALTLGNSLAASDISLCGSGIKRDTSYLVISASLVGATPSQAFDAFFSPDPAVAALVLQQAISAVPSLNGVVKVFNPVLPVAPVNPPVFIPKRGLDFISTRVLSSDDQGRLRGAIAASMGISSSEIFFLGSGIADVNKRSSFVVTAIISGDSAVLAYTNMFSADPNAAALLIQAAINAIPSLNGVVSIVNPSLPPPPVAPPGTRFKTKKNYLKSGNNF